MASNKDLHKMSANELGKLFPIIIQEPDKNWEKIFRAEKELILEQFEGSGIIRIEHFGSTAIPNLKAKPTIDILIEISPNLEENRIIRTLKKIAYEYIRQPDNPPPHMMFAKGYTVNGFKGQSFHIHVRYKGDWDELYFRDYLIQNEQQKKEYEKLKLDLAIKYRNNRDAYTKAKTGFIKSINKLARQAKQKNTTA